MPADPLSFAHRCTRRWFQSSFAAPTEAQALGWPPIVARESTLLLAPTGSGKTLAAFLVGIDRLMFGEPPEKTGVRLLYISPLKALGVDVERNLRAPLAGIRAVAEEAGERFRWPQVGVRSGDTPQKERRLMGRQPPEILITTPESLYLMLTSRVREILRTVETVIVDEIHAMVARKRGAHLFLSLERLQHLCGRGFQRIGLSATQRPLDEVARLLGGAEPPPADGPVTPRPVCIVDASTPKQFELRVEVPVEDMARLAEQKDPQSGAASEGGRKRSIWPSIYPRLIELIRSHRSTMLFVNSRRLAERLAGALNEVAEAEIARAHHGSMARALRSGIEERLKSGDLPAIVATSSLELGIDMGAVDLVVQIEAPTSVASGVQRIGRAGHHVGAVSHGVIFPKYRGDLLACAAIVRHIRAGRVEASYYPRNPLDVLAQQIVAMLVAGPLPVEVVYGIVRAAAPFAELPRRSFEGVLDMLSGRYPSDEFGDLRARLTWDRVAGVLRPRRGSQLLAIANAGTIPDRGLYGVFLAGAEKPTRVGELDEEMVFESRTGDVFLLGASSWRIQQITHDRVLVSPAPGEPGKMPFWHGDAPGRPLELGQAIGALTRELLAVPAAQGRARLRQQHALDERAADNLLRYLADQTAAGAVPTDRLLVVERFLDELGDWCVALLTPFGARVHAPWVTAVAGRLRTELGCEPDTMWSDDGMVFRLPASASPPELGLFLPEPDDIEALVVRQLADTSLFAARFRENAARALLIPTRRPGKRTPLWVQRRRSAQLLQVAARYPDFPIILETYRECLRDVFDVPALRSILADIKTQRLAVRELHSRQPSPFAASLLFAYVARFIYEGDAPLAERRAQMLSLDHAQLRELLGEPELRELLDPEAISAIELRLQRLDGRGARHVDALHDLLLSLGDLSRAELEVRCHPPSAAAAWLAELATARRLVQVTVAGEPRWIASEDSGRYRDALGCEPPPGLPAALLEPVAAPLVDLLSRYARSHGPFHLETAAARFGLGRAPVLRVLQLLAEAERVVEGEFVPGGRGREWCDLGVLRQLKRRSLARLRAQVEPVEPEALGRFLADWHGLDRPRAGMAALLGVIEKLQGAALPVSDLEGRILPARLERFDRRDLDELCASGEVLWRGVQPLKPRDGRIALYLADHYALLAPPVEALTGSLHGRIRGLLAERGALFFRDLCAQLGGYPPEILAGLYELVWNGEVSNDTLAPLRSLRTGQSTRSRPRHGVRPKAPRRAPPGSSGRWWLLPQAQPASPSATERAQALVNQLLSRHGLLTREAVAAESVLGGFSALYPVLKAFEEAGRVRRGYFVEGLGAAQFGLPGAEDRLRRHRWPDLDRVTPPARVLAACDPAQPWGHALPWPGKQAAGEGPQKRAEARVVLWEGRLLGYLAPLGQSLLSFLPEVEPERGHAAELLSAALAREKPASRVGGLLLERIDGEPAARSWLLPFLEAEGFVRSGQALRRP